MKIKSILTVPVDLYIGDKHVAYLKPGDIIEVPDEIGERLLDFDYIEEVDEYTNIFDVEGGN